MNMHRFAMTLTTSLILLLAGTGLAHATGVDDGFDPNANDAVRTIVVQRDGKLLVGGEFTNIGGETRNLVARLNADGSASADFDPDVQGSSNMVLALHEQLDGKVLIGGRFATVSGEQRSNIARVSATGALDTTFNPVFDSTVASIASQLSPDGLSGFIYVAGEFHAVNGQQRERIARLLPDGSLDTSYVPPVFDRTIYAIKMQDDGRLLAAGAFTTVDGVATNAPVVRLNPDGSLDPTFSAELFSSSNSPIVVELAVQPDGKILIGGFFNGVAGQQRNNVARLHADGQLDDDFVPPEFDEIITSMVLQADGRIMVGGMFTNDFFHQGMARLYSDGSYDSSFSSLAIGGVYTLARQADGKYAVGGDISQFGAYLRNHIARLDEIGAPDADFIADLSDGPDGIGLAVALQADGRVLVGGVENSAGNSRLTRLVGNGLPDPTFSAFINGVAYAIIAQPNEKIVIAGNFDNVADRIARLNADGSLDNTFVANANDYVFAAALQRDGRIVVGGRFLKINGIPRVRLARLLLNGAPDPTFNATVNGDVRAVVIQPDGKVLIGGDFTKVNGQSQAHIARLNANGSVDSGFVANVNGTVRSIVVDAQWRILTGGDFDMVGATSRVAIARLLQDGSVDTTFANNYYDASTVVTSTALMSNGRIIIAGGYSSGIGFVRRLSKNGTQDLTFDPGFVSFSFIQSVVIQPDGKVLFAGDFGSVDGQPRSVVARYAQTDPATESLDIFGSELGWIRKGSGPELSAAPSVLWSTTCCNREDFVPLPNGVMQRAPNAWVLVDIPTAGEGTIWLRAVSIAGAGGRTVTPIESPIFALKLGATEPSDRIFASGFEVPVPD